jgi:DNA-binding MarR family transcriptional regulator
MNPEEFLDSPSVKLHRATVLLDRLADDYLRSHHGIRYAPFLVLLMLGILGPSSQQRLASNLDVSRASITQRISGLSAEGLVRVDVDPADARAHRVELSERGRELLERAWSGLDAHQDGVDRGVDGAALAAQLDLVIANATAALEGRS